MPNAIILHGTSCSPESFWYPWLKQELEQAGYAVWLPQLPDTDHPSLETWLPFVLEHGTFTPETVIVSHSAGCPLTLAVLERLQQPIAQAVLVAGYARRKGDQKAPEAILPEQYNWEVIQRNVKELICINSDNDPWGCTDEEGKFITDHVNGKLIVKLGEGHFGSDSYNQPYKQFPLLKELILHVAA